MTARRDIPIIGDSLAWVHNELAELKSRVALAQQSAEQSRILASDASDKALQVRGQLEQFDGHGSAILHLQDGLSTLHDHLVRDQEDIHALQLGYGELDRRIEGNADRIRQDRNEIARRFTEIERALDAWTERFAGIEELNRRNLEAAAHLAQRIEALEANQLDAESLRTRTVTAINRIDEEIQRLSGEITMISSEDNVQVERINSAFEMLRRLESEIEAVQSETNRISRLDDRLELVQAERTRHNERLNELSRDMELMQRAINEQSERTSVVEARMSGYQGELRNLREALTNDREQIKGYLHGLNGLLAELRKRQIAVLEKEIRDIRGRELSFPDE